MPILLLQGMDVCLAYTCKLHNTGSHCKILWSLRYIECFRSIIYFLELEHDIAGNLPFKLCKVPLLSGYCNMFHGTGNNVHLVSIFLEISPVLYTICLVLKHLETYNLKKIIENCSYEPFTIMTGNLTIHSEWFHKSWNNWQQTNPRRKFPQYLVLKRA